MFRGIAIVGVVLSFLSVHSCLGQVCQTSHQTDLYCLIPSAFHTKTAPFNALYTPFGTELSQLPIAKPAGLKLVPERGLLVTTNESLGPVFSGRAESIGRNRWFVGGTFQRFAFNGIDGNKLGNLPIVLSFNNGAGTVYTVTTNRFDIKANQYSFIAAYGITERLDVSVAVPIERIAMSVAINGVETEAGITPVSFKEYVPGTSSGFGDVLLGAKFTLMDRKNLSLAGGLDMRVPSGDEYNFLGSGALGIRPYVALSKQGRFSPHINFGYQWNGNSALNANSQGQNQQLPTDLFYAVGADGTVTKKVTLVADLLGRRVFDAPRLSSPQNSPVVGATTVVPVTSSYTRNDLSIGVKGQSYLHLVFTGNLLIKLDSGGLRSTIAPLAGISYSF